MWVRESLQHPSRLLCTPDSWDSRHYQQTGESGAHRDPGAALLRREGPWRPQSVRRAVKGQPRQLPGARGLSSSPSGALTDTRRLLPVLWDSRSQGSQSGEIPRQNFTRIRGRFWHGYLIRIHKVLSKRSDSEHCFSHCIKKLKLQVVLCILISLFRLYFISMLRYHQSSQMAKTQKHDNAHCWWGCGEAGTLLIVSGNAKLHNSTERHLQYRTRLHMYLSQQPHY